MLGIEQDIATQRLRSLAAVDRIAAEQLALRDSLASQQKDLLAAAEEGVQKRLEMAAELLKYREAAAKVTDALDNGISQIPQFLLFCHTRLSSTFVPICTDTFLCFSCHRSRVRSRRSDSPSCSSRHQEKR
jgi:hypothetical protein